MKDDIVELTPNLYPFLAAMQAKAGLTLRMFAERGGEKLVIAVILVGYFTYDAMIDHHSDPFALYICLIAVPVLMLWSGWDAFSAWRKARGALPLHLYHWGDSHAVAREIEADFAGQAVTSLPVQFGKRWLCYVRGDHAVASPLASFVWAYGGATDRPTDSSNRFSEPAIVLFTRQGSKFELDMARTDVAGALAALSQAAPWMPVGFTTAMLNSWNDDRKELLALVDQAREGQASFASATANAGVAALTPPAEAQRPPTGIPGSRIISAVVIAVIAIYLYRTHPLSN